ncbi:PAS domain-containing protein [Patulibacter sp.]|uniref:PAS domain-containing protein n=1 Tax=Patulibacter sp. TaxID=1912859 RepID=UPI002719A089|nr:PAS domain-containing protein [Patulibacter sp.]MDO9410688.1 PAS domain-containing protein [Patulibacter sp.]
MTAGPPGVPDLISSLSQGTVPIVVEPVHTAAQAAELDLMLWRIRGTSAVELRELDAGEATFDVGLGRPVAMASDLRTLFGRDLVSCRREDGVFRVRLSAPPVTHDLAAPDGHAAPLTGRWEAASPDVPGPDDGDGTPVGDDPDEPIAPVPLGAPLRLADPAVLVDALDADPTTLVLLIDHELVIRAVHGGLPAPWGDHAPPAVGASLNDVAPPHLHRGLADRVSAVLRGADVAQVWTTADGGDAHEVALRPVQRDGRVIGCRATVSDVSDRRHDRELLRDLTAVFEVAFREAPDGQGLLAPDGTWLRSNPALHRLLGRSSGELRGRALADLLEPADAGREAELRLEAERGDRERYAVDLDPRVAAAAGVGVRVLAAAIRAPGGGVRGYVVHAVTTDELPDELTPEIVEGPW